jgi:hypothetical protein
MARRAATNVERTSCLVMEEHGATSPEDLPLSSAISARGAPAISAAARFACRK